MAIQERNSEMVSLLSVDFIQKTDTVYLAGIAAGSILMLPGLVAFWPMGISLSDDNTLYADALAVTGTATFSGQIGITWTALTLNTVGNWADVGAGQQTARYKKVGDLVFVQGFVVRSSGTNATVLTMPSGARPPAIVNVIVSADDAYGRLTFNTDGTVIMNAGTAATFLQLNNIWFSTL